MEGVWSCDSDSDEAQDCDVFLYSVESLEKYINLAKYQLSAITSVSISDTDIDSNFQNGPSLLNTNRKESLHYYH